MASSPKRITSISLDRIAKAKFVLIAASTVILDVENVYRSIEAVGIPEHDHPIARNSTGTRTKVQLASPLHIRNRMATPCQRYAVD